MSLDRRSAARAHHVPARALGEIQVSCHANPFTRWWSAMKTPGVLLLICALFCAPAVPAQAPASPPLLPDKDTILVTVFLRHDQSMNNVQRREVLDRAGFDKMFPPKGVEIVNHYVMMGIGQVIVLRLPPDHLRALNMAIENGAWGAYKTEFYVTYDLAAAQKAAAKP